MKNAPDATELIASNKNLFIEASAGTGKTTLITRLIAQIIVAERASIDQILCVTFTEKAASELKAKIFAELKLHDTPAATKAREAFSTNRIGTIHNFCLRNLREHLATVGDGGLIRDEEIFDEAREWAYREVFAEFDPNELGAHLAATGFGKGGRDRSFDKFLKSRALFAFAAGKHNIDPNISEKAQVTNATQFRAYILARIIARMQEIIIAKDALTFSRMITLFAQALENPAIEHAVRAQHSYAIIDEFQDTDAVQWEIFGRLFLKDTPTRLILVGDPKQAIYKFRGADVFVYLKARETMRSHGARIESLPVNYRSAPEILQFLGDLFASAEAQTTWGRAAIEFSAPIFGGERKSTGATTGVEIYRASDSKTEKIEHYIAVLASRIEQLRVEQPNWSIAVIAFSHNHLVDVSQALKERGIDFAYYKPKPEFERIEFEHLKIFLQSFSLAEDEGFSLACVTVFGHAADLESYRRLRRAAENGRIRDLLLGIAQNQQPLHLLLQSDRDETLYHKWRLLFEYLLSLVGNKIFDLMSLAHALHELLQDEDRETLNDMLRAPEAVTLMTVQSSKGLDFDAVFLADGGNDSRFSDSAFFHDASGLAIIPIDGPAFDASDNKLMTIEDESKISQLNLLYVAATRARYKFVVAIIQPGNTQKLGPTRRYIEPWLDSGAGTDLVKKLKTAHEKISPSQLPKLAAENQKSQALPEHGDIAGRVRRRTSFTELAQNIEHAVAPMFIADVLPRGAQTGVFLHDYLEHCDFQYIAPENSRTLLALLANFSEGVVRERVTEILKATAEAQLPLQGSQAITRLKEISPDNLWREMPFWSDASLHPAAASIDATMMHGYMDLVFTLDEKDYYILDYKSNSLADIDPTTISEYTLAHYEKQAQIYSEALSAYLTKSFPSSGKSVKGCFFLFLRYLKANTSAGVHFIRCEV